MAGGEAAARIGRRRGGKDERRREGRVWRALICGGTSRIPEREPPPHHVSGKTRRSVAHLLRTETMDRASRPSRNPLAKLEIHPSTRTRLLLRLQTSTTPAWWPPPAFTSLATSRRVRGPPSGGLRALAARATVATIPLPASNEATRHRRDGRRRRRCPRLARL